MATEVCGDATPALPGKFPGRSITYDVIGSGGRRTATVLGQAHLPFVVADVSFS